MKTPLVLASLTFAALLAGCAHAPRSAPAVSAAVPETAAPEAAAPALPASLAEALKPIAPLEDECLGPLLHATYAFSGQEPAEQARKMRLENYVYSFIDVRAVGEYQKCLDAHPGVADAEKQKALAKQWLATSQKGLAEAEAGVPEGERLADASEVYTQLDATHGKTVVTLTRRNGQKDGWEQTFETPEQKP